jgi:zinc protease
MSAVSLRLLLKFCVPWMAVLAALVCGPAHANLPIQQWALPNGAQVFLVESPSIPMVDVQIDFDAGARRDAPAQAGLASAMAAMLSSGVRAQGDLPALDENQLGEAWADLGASFGASASSDRLSLALRSLTYPDLLDQAARLAARQIGEPAFPEAVWQRERERMKASLKESETRPATLAGKQFARAVYGDHPYGQQSTEQTLARISVADMRERHARMLQPCRAKVSIVGALNREQAQALATTLLSKLAHGSGTGCAPLPAVTEVAPLAQAVEHQVRFASAQAHVLIGQPGFKRDDPDFFALTLGNHILGGGGMVSRLFAEVREKRGLSYSVYSYFAPGLHAGAFTIGLQTRPDQASEAVSTARELLARFVEQGPSEAELQAAKDNLIGGFPLLIDSNRKLLGNVANIAWNGLPLDYLINWTRRVEAITAADVKAAFARKLQPDRMVTVVVGGMQ